MPKAKAGAKSNAALVAIGLGMPALTTFDPVRYAGRWTFARP
jgi:hypothetical protein